MRKSIDRIALIGDVHGKMGMLEDITRRYDRTICTEIGFVKEHKAFLDNIYQDGKHHVLFGNHDFYPWFNEEHSLKNWCYYPEYDLFTIRGAWSIDSMSRTEGRTWFANEEMNYAEAQEVLEAYIKIKPSRVFAHEIPQTIKEEIFGFKNKTITNQLLQACIDNHAPEIWIHGHYHHSHHTLIGDTLYIGLDELEVYELEKPIYHSDAKHALDDIGIGSIYDEEAYEKFLEDADTESD
jgi:hypothetical protein